MIFKQNIGIANCVKIFVDMETGVEYLFSANGYAGGLTPLLDRDGKPMLAPFAQTYSEEK